MRISAALGGLGAALLAAGILTACAPPAGSGSTPSGSSSSGPSPSATTGGSGHDSEISAAWLDNGRLIAIVTRGSSTCVPKVGDVAYADGVLQVKFDGVLHGGSADAEVITCTDDLATRATIVAVPEGVDPADELEIRVTGDGYAGSTDLDGVAGLDPSGETDYLPSAGWADDDQFVVLSWGSSTCVPTLASAEVSSPTEITVTFATPPADQVCTMDMAPRGVVAQVPDDSALDDDAEVFAVLTGGEFDNVRVPIIGND